METFSLPFIGAGPGRVSFDRDKHRSFVQTSLSKQPAASFSSRSEPASHSEKTNTTGMRHLPRKSPFEVSSILLRVEIASTGNCLQNTPILLDIDTTTSTVCCVQSNLWDGLWCFQGRYATLRSSNAVYKTCTVRSKNDVVDRLFGVLGKKRCMLSSSAEVVFDVYKV